MKNSCAASTRAAVRSRDYRRSARYYAAGAHKSVHRWSSSGDCRSLARKNLPECRCCYAGRHCLPRGDDRSSRGHAVKLNSARSAWGDHPSYAESSARVRSLDDSSSLGLAAGGHGPWPCPALPRCGRCRRALDCCSLLRHSWSGCRSAWPKAAGSARGRAGARSFRNSPARCRGDSRTGRRLAYCRAHQSCQPGRWLLCSERRSSCARVDARQPVREPSGP